MKWRKTLAWCLSLALLLGMVSVTGLLSAVAADEAGATVVPLKPGKIFTTDNEITNLMTTRTQLGVSGGNLQTSCDKYFDGIVPGITTTAANWGDWNGLAADTDYYLWYDFGTATPLNVIELGGINGHSGFPTYTLPGFSLYATDDLEALQKGTLTPLATVSATETAKNKGFVAVLDSTVSVRYVGVKIRSYSHVGKSQECWISEFGAACVTDAQKKELIKNGNAYVKYVNGALAYALTEAPAQTSLIGGQTPIAGANTAYGKTEVGSGTIAALTDGQYPGLNQMITVARNADGHEPQLKKNIQDQSHSNERQDPAHRGLRAMRAPVADRAALFGFHSYFTSDKSLARSSGHSTPSTRPTTFSGGIAPTDALRLSFELFRLSPITNTMPSGTVYAG